MLNVHFLAGVIHLGRELLIGLDVGTTRACALVVGGAGGVRGRADLGGCAIHRARWAEAIARVRDVRG